MTPEVPVVKAAPVTLSDITKSLDVAVAAARAKKELHDLAKKAAAEAEGAFNLAMEEARSWHQKYNDFMTSVLTNFGTVHK